MQVKPVQDDSDAFSKIECFEPGSDELLGEYIQQGILLHEPAVWMVEVLSEAVSATLPQSP